MKLAGMLPMSWKKAILLRLLDDILDSKTHSIDKQLGELIVAKVIKSTGNNITAFIVRDE